MAPVDLLRELVEIESPTYTEGVRGVAERFLAELEPFGAQARFFEGDHLVVDLDGYGDPLMLVGHSDTVWPLGTLDELPFRIEDGRAYGPGTFDMKSGLVIIAEGIQRAGRRRALRVFLTGDEENGTRDGRTFLEQSAEGVSAALVTEPPAADGSLTTSRRGIGRYWLSIAGRPSHAGIARDEGVSAVEELAHQILHLHGQTRGSVSFNVGTVTGGTTRNVVAAKAEAGLDVRVANAEDIATVEEILAGLQPVLAGTSLSLTGGWTRPPLERNPETLRLFGRYQSHAARMGLEIGEQASGGGSDANLLAAVGVPVLDGLGAEGHGAHARDEHIVVESLAVRSELLARMIEDPEL